MIWKIADILMARFSLQCDGRSTSLLYIPQSRLYNSSHLGLAIRIAPSMITGDIGHGDLLTFKRHNLYPQQLDAKILRAISPIALHFTLEVHAFIGKIRSVILKGSNGHGERQTGRSLDSR